MKPRRAPVSASTPKSSKKITPKLVTIAIAVSLLLAVIAIIISASVATAPNQNEQPKQTAITEQPAITEPGTESEPVAKVETPVIATKPTDATTGPRTSTSNRSGGSLSGGTYQGVRFTGDIEIPEGAAPVTLTDCIIDGSLSIHSSSLVTLDHCDVNGWFGHRTNNQDPARQLLVVKHSKFTGKTDNDAVRFGNTIKWGDNTTYQNVLIEDTIFYSPFSSTDPSAHFDVMQFGGGNNYTFNRVAISFIKDSPAGVGVAYINNDTKNGNVVFNNLWIEGGPVTYVIRGPLVVNTCTIESSTVKYGYLGGTKATLNNCFNEKGESI